MLINKIILKNFISCENVEIKLPKGLIGISGNNGSGKSSIFRDGVFYSLYGQSLRNKDLKKYIHKGKKDFASCLEFNIGKNDYAVIRTHNDKNQKKTHFLINGVEENSLKTDIQKYIDEIITLDKELFSQTILITPDSKCLLELSNADRKSFFYKLLNLEQFDKLYDLAHKKNNELDKKCNIIEHDITQALKKNLQHEEYLRKNEKNTDIDYILAHEKAIMEYRENVKLQEYIESEYKKNVFELDAVKFNLKKYYKEEEINNISKIKYDIGDIQENISLLKGQIQNNNNVITKFKKLLSSTLTNQHKCPTCDQEVNADDLNKMIAKYEQENNSLTLDLNVFNLKKEKVSLCKKYLEQKAKFEESKIKYDSMKKNSEEYENYSMAEVLNAKEFKNKISSVKKEISKNKEDIEKLKLQLNSNKEILKKLANIKSFAKNTPDLLIEKIFKGILEKSNELLALLPNNIPLNVEDINESMNLYSTSSTGERFKLNIIIRISMNIILSDVLKKNPIELLILDEGGLGNLDLSIANEIVAILHDLISNDILKQIFLITHTTDLLEYCDYKLYVEKRTGKTHITTT